MTKRDYFNTIKAAMADNADIVAFCDKEIAALDKRNAVRKPSKKTVANAALAKEVLAVMAPGTAYTTADLMGVVPADAGTSPQKLAGLMGILAKDGLVTVEVVKRKNVYRLA